MKTVIGFMCGIAGMMLSIVMFIVGCMCGDLLNEWVNKKED